MKNSFTEEDKQKLIDFLNMVAKHATFNLKTTEIIEYFKLLSFMQQVMLSKVNDNILEVKRVVEAEKETPEESKEEKLKTKKK